MKKALAIAGLATAISLASVHDANAVSAAQQLDGTGKTARAAKPASPKAEDTKIDSKVVDHKETRKPPMLPGQKSVKEGEGPSAEFDKFVTEGKITQDQANQLKAKFAEVENFKFGLENKNEQERDAILRAKVDTFKQWVATQHLPAEVVPTLLVHDGSDGQGHGLEIGFKN